MSNVIIAYNQRAYSLCAIYKIAYDSYKAALGSYKTVFDG